MNYFKNVTRLLSADLIATAITIIATPIVLRVYDVGDFGRYEVYMATTTILSVVGMLGFENVVFFQASKQDQFVALLLACLTSLVMNCLFAIAIVGLFFFWALPVDCGTWLWAVPISCFQINLFNLMCIFCTKNGDIRALVYCKVAGSISAIICQCSFSFFGLGHVGLVLSNLLAQCIVSLFLGCMLSTSLRSSATVFDMKRMKIMAAENWRMPFMSLPGSFLVNLRNNLPTYFFSLLNNELVGHYFLAKRVVGFPIQALSNSLRPLFQHALSESIAADGIASKVYIRHLMYYSIAGSMLLLSVLLFAPFLTVFFGSKWADSVPMIMVFSIGFIFSFVFGSLGIIMFYGKLPIYDLGWQVFASLVLALSLITSYLLTANPIVMAFSFSISYVFSYSIYGYMGYRASRNGRLLSTKN